MSQQLNWYPVKINQGVSFNPSKYALGILLENGGVNNVVAFVERQKNSKWKWIVAASLIPPPYNFGDTSTMHEAMETAMQEIKNFEPEPEAKPCPFCGSSKINHESVGSMGAHGRYMRCQNCSATGGYIFDFEEAEMTKWVSLQRWNKRT